MSIKLRFEKGSLATQVHLKDEALTELNGLVTKYQTDDVPASGVQAVVSATDLADPSISAKKWLSQHSAPEVLNLVGWKNYPEKIVLLGAFHEAAGAANEGWRSADIESRFSEARESFTANFARDIKTAIKDGLVATVTPRTYKVSRTGWNRISEAVTRGATA